MFSSEDSPIIILRSTFVYVNLYILPIFYILGNLGSLISMFVFMKKSWKKNVCVFYFKICLIIQICYINSGLLAAIFIYGLNIHAEVFHPILCKCLYYAAYTFSVLLPTILILASIDRLLISSQHVDTRLYSSKRLAYFSVTIGTCFWVIFYIHVLIKVNIFEFYPNVFVCYYETSGFYFEFMSYSFMVINVVLSVILIILSILTLKNIRRIRAMRQRNEIRMMNKKDFQLLRCLYVHDIVYIIFVAFPSMYNVYRAIKKNLVYSAWRQALVNFFENFRTFIHHIPFCVSFIIFIYVSKAFRLEIKRLCQKICNKQVMPTQEEDNRQQNNPNQNIQLNVVNASVVLN